ncbi:LysR family transcriptional regulator [Paludibacterium paludis]|uniref:LysR family transcriptional regulator n=1 Tax=Paludibacterium paludis TaxID=1225769 RepID=A0A918P3R3_9NEIS|nr:LysR family transcriptional regulator [Paludibacterium paludis]GGY17751.1 LysR family transcriptional regulator [Paludibacterium paludis]
MLDRLLSMEVFVAVVNDGTFTAAAERFGLSRPMVGKHVQSLEERLGTRLLVRTTRRQHLTEAGRQYYLQCREVLARIAEIDEETRLFGQQVRGHLRISAPVTFGSLRVAPALSEFMERYPQVSVELAVSDHLADLVEEGYDALIRIGALHEDNLVARPLEPYRMMMCAAPSYLARKGVPASTADLAGHACLGLTAWRGERGWTLGGEPAFGNSRFVSNNGQSLKAVAIAGGGIVMQPEVLLADALADGRLVEILAHELPPPKPMHLMYRRDRLASPKLAALVEFLLARFGAKT